MSQSTQIRRNLRNLLAGSLFGALAVFGLYSASSVQAQVTAPKTLRIGYQLVPNGDLVVKDKKWLEAALPNTKVEWIKFDSGGDVNTAIVANAIDIGLAGSSPVTRGLSAPLNIAYQVPWIFDVIGSSEALIVRKATNINTIAGLKGKTIATPFASTSHYSLLAALEDAKIDAKDVKIVDLAPQDIVAAWTRGDIDAAYVWTPFLGELRKNGTTLTSSEELAKKGKTTLDLAVVRSAFAQEFPAAVQVWLQQQDKAVKLYRSNPQDAAASIARQLNLTPAEALAQAKELVWLDAAQQAGADYLGTPGKPGKLADNLYSAAQFLKSQGKIEAISPLATYQKGLANQFVTQVAAFK